MWWLILLLLPKAPGSFPLISGSSWSNLPIAIGAEISDTQALVLEISQYAALSPTGQSGMVRRAVWLCGCGMGQPACLRGRDVHYAISAA